MGFQLHLSLGEHDMQLCHFVLSHSAFQLLKGLRKGALLVIRIGSNLGCVCIG